ncbi:hypothetical protein [Niabella beijingensis]|uniref:hypothetical protein n=1 Tax=Niabella beijingensis TaxID=2872700 RepID=UPI001CBF9014|nr:hypothetical protein [Niabella beijingensis]
MGTTTFLGAFAAFLSSFVSFFATLFSITGTNSLTAVFFTAAFFSFAGAGVALPAGLDTAFTGVFAATFDVFPLVALTAFTGVFAFLAAAGFGAVVRAAVDLDAVLLLVADLEAAFAGVFAAGLLALPLALPAAFTGAFAVFPPAVFAGAFAATALPPVERPPEPLRAGAGFAAVFFFVAIVLPFFCYNRI